MIFRNRERSVTKIRILLCSIFLLRKTAIVNVSVEELIAGGEDVDFVSIVDDDLCGGGGGELGLKEGLSYDAESLDLVLVAVWARPLALWVLECHGWKETVYKKSNVLFAADDCLSSEANNILHFLRKRYLRKLEWYRLMH